MASFRVRERAGATIITGTSWRSGLIAWVMGTLGVSGVVATVSQDGRVWLGAVGVGLILALGAGYRVVVTVEGLSFAWCWLGIPLHVRRYTPDVRATEYDDFDTLKVQGTTFNGGGNSNDVCFGAVRDAPALVSAINEALHRHAEKKAPSSSLYR